MATFSQTKIFTTTQNPGPIIDLQSSAYGYPATIELAMTISGGSSASSFGIGRSSNTPVQLAPFPLQPEEDPAANPSFSTLGMIWSLAPNAPAHYFRQAVHQTFGDIIWTFPRGLRQPPGTSMVLYNTSGNSTTVTAWWEIDE